ncbi:MAG TPA: RNA polymerase sigma factor [Lacisediminihabitans sp.]|uniref:RNA polymerase sigma factor n=1 Tax=Lacisediminihabitans sp. TaxID=2787631 RepID=UPI002ED98008
MDMKKPFENIVAEHGPTVLRVCRAVVGFDEADDAWSETFLSAMTAYPSLPDDANVEAWLVTIAHRKAIDVIRVRKRIAIPVEEVPDRPSSLGIADSSDREVWDHVRSLPDRQRQAVAYHYLAGLPYLEIAAILGGTTDAARRAASDGMKTLRKTFAGTDRHGGAR